MTIEIHKPELEALIRERMRSGIFESVEDALLQALKSAPLPGVENSPQSGAPIFSGADLVAVMQSSPCKEISLEPIRGPLPVRDTAFE